MPAEHADKKSLYITHLPDDAVDDAWEHFRQALMPLHSAGKLGAVFFQFPDWFTNRRDNREYLDTLPHRLPDYQIAVEFRHVSWLDGDSADKTLKQLEQSHAATDACPPRRRISWRAIHRS